MKQYKGDLEGFPSEVVERMLDEQVRQGNERDVSVFENWYRSGVCEGGFTWSHSDEGHNFWLEVIYMRDFDLFFERYPIQWTPSPTDDIFIRTMYVDPSHTSNEGCKSWSDEISDSVDWSVNIKGDEVEIDIQLIPKCKIIYAQGKEVIFDLDDFAIENNMLIIKAK